MKTVYIVIDVVGEIQIACQDREDAEQYIIDHQINGGFVQELQFIASRW